MVRFNALQVRSSALEREGIYNVSANFEKLLIQKGTVQRWGRKNLCRGCGSPMEPLLPPPGNAGKADLWAWAIKLVGLGS